MFRNVTWLSCRQQRCTPLIESLRVRISPSSLSAHHSSTFASVTKQHDFYGAWRNDSYMLCTAVAKVQKPRASTSVCMANSTVVLAQSSHRVRHHRYSKLQSPLLWDIRIEFPPLSNLAMSLKSSSSSSDSMGPAPVGVDGTFHQNSPPRPIHCQSS